MSGNFDLREMWLKLFETKISVSRKKSHDSCKLAFEKVLNLGKSLKD